MDLSPIGLSFAAVLALLLCLGEICNKKVVQGQQVLAAVFWIRVFAAVEISVVLLFFVLRGSPPVIHVPAALIADDLRNLKQLVEHLRHPHNLAEQHIASHLSPSTRNLLARYDPADGDAITVPLIAELNSEKMLGGPLLYSASADLGVKVSPFTQGVLAMHPRGEVRTYANRLLLEDAYPNMIAPRRTCALFGVKSWQVPPTTAYLCYLLFEVILVMASQSLTTYALKISPLSLSIPFTTFAPVFLLGTGYLVLSELPTRVQLLGIALIMVGGVLMQRKLFAVSWKAPVQAIWREKGSRYILFSVLISSLYGPVEKQLILMSDPLTTAFGYGIGTVLASFVACRIYKIGVIQVMRERPGWALLSGLSDANTLFAQFITVMYLPVVIAICIKRAGIVITVLAGWLIFKERDIADRLIASCAMVGGIAILYLPLQFSQALIVCLLTLMGVGVAIYFTRSNAPEGAVATATASH